MGRMSVSGGHRILSRDCQRKIGHLPACFFCWCRLRGPLLFWRGAPSWRPLLRWPLWRRDGGEEDGPCRKNTTLSKPNLTGKGGRSNHARILLERESECVTAPGPLRWVCEWAPCARAGPRVASLSPWWRAGSGGARVEVRCTHAQPWRSGKRSKKIYISYVIR